MSKVQQGATKGKRGAHRKDLTGKRFGRWTVLSMRWAPGQTWAHCRCDCGTTRDVAAGTLSYGSSTSCGCIAAEKAAARTKHGGCSGDGSRLYSVWHDMRRRCSSQTRDDYPLYGGRGVYVCEGWQDFGAFLADVGERPDGMSLDRIDANGSYTCGHCEQCIERGAPKNVRWATAKEQVRNRRTTLTATHDGITRPLVEWATLYRVPYDTLHDRVTRLHWPIKRALTTPVQIGRNQFTRN